MHQAHTYFPVSNFWNNRYVFFRLKLHQVQPPDAGYSMIEIIDC